MAFDEALADRLRSRLADRPGVSERRMFGCLIFLTRGNMTIGVAGDDLVVRLGAAAAESALRRPGVTTFDLTRRPMRNWVRVEAAAVSDDALAAWLAEASAFVSALPAKE
jgi:hypothetical protein